MFKKDILKTLNLKLKNIISKGNSLQFCLLVALVGVLLVFVSNLFSPKSNFNKNLETKSKTEIYTLTKKYKEDLENSVKDIISSMKEVGKNPKVLISLESTEQNVYATENKKSTETVKDSYGNYVNSDQTKLKETNETETKYIKIRDQDGSEKALSVTKIQPAIKGVVIVCPGGENQSVKEKVTEAVKTALNIPSKKVFVTA